jgi:predicted ATP-grasp superfamily ATP-dependent carboligase
MTAKRVPVILLGGGGVNGLGIARNFGRLGIDVYCATATRNDLVTYSKYCRTVFHVPGVDEHPDRMTAFLHTFSRQIVPKAYLHPTSDFAILTLSQMLPQLEPFVAVIPDHTTVETIVNKRKFYQSLEKTRIPHPRTCYVDTNHIVTGYPALSYPIFVKPSISQRFFREFGQKGFVAHTQHDLDYYLQVAAQHRIEVMMQEVIAGPTTNLYTINGYFDVRSRPLFLIARRKIRQPTMFSNNSVALSVPLTEVEKPVQYIVEYLSSLKYRGLFTSEWKKSIRDDRFYLLEVNARSGSLNNHVVQCGVNHILMAYRDALGLPVYPVSQYATGVYCITVMTDITSIFRRMRSHDLTVQDMIRPYISKKHWATMSWDDPLPFVLHYFRELLNRMRAQG